MAVQSILIAEDDANIREILALYFARAGFKVIEAADGSEAIRKAEGQPPDIILLDNRMPVLSGSEVCRHIRRYSRVPIIMLSAKAIEPDRQWEEELDIDDYIAKPFHMKDVLARVNALLDLGNH